MDVVAKKRYAYRCQVTRVLLGQAITNEIGAPVVVVAPESVFDLTTKAMPDLTELTALLTRKAEE